MRTVNGINLLGGPLRSSMLPSQARASVMSSGPFHSEQRQLFNAVRDGSHRFDTVEDVLRSFLGPLEPLLGTELTSSLLDAPLASGSSPTLTIPAVSVIEAAQEALLTKVAVDWQDALSQHGLFHPLLDACFFASAESAASVPSSCGLIQQCGLRVASRILSSGHVSTANASTTTSKLHPLVCSALLHICSRATSQLSLESLVQSALAETNKTRRSVSWTDTLRLLTSFPDRIANFTLGDVPDYLGREEWYARITQGLAHALKVPAALQQGKAELLAEAVSRLEKVGYLAAATTQHTGGKLDFWPVFLRSGTVDSAQSSSTNHWLETTRKLTEESAIRVSRSLVSTMDESARRACGTTIVSQAEKLKPGSEGTAFLSTATHTFVVAAWTILEQFLPCKADLEDVEDEEDSVHLSLALSSLPQVSAMAWVWGSLLTQSEEKRLVQLLTRTLQHWADAGRIKRSTMEHEQYLTTLIICLLASISSSSSEDDNKALVEVSRSPALLEGVSRHLEHPDPAIRRLGMLIAELISAKTTAEGVKGLQFGRGIWDGTGQGREEARVLRALYDGWAYHLKSIRQLRNNMDTDLLLTTLGIGLVDSSTSQLVIVDKTRRGKRPSGPPKSRKLPANVAPPQRANASRSLITMLGSDEEDEVAVDTDQLSAGETPLLKMFTPNRSGRADTQRSLLDQEDVSSPEEDAGDSSDSSADADDGTSDKQNKMHKLAAELAGLNASETSTLLGPAGRKPTPARPRASATNFEADREAHAPTFGDKRARPPVYISQLAPLLKSNERASVKLGLKYAAVLIRRKSSVSSGGRGEVDENAVDLGLSLIALHNNFTIGKFEERRLEALVSLLVGSSRITAAVMTEQVFGSQYSIAQRFGMLTAIAQGALELADVNTARVQHTQILDRKARELGDVATTKAKNQGEEKVPAIRRERNLLVNGHQRQKGPLIQQMPTQHASSRPLALTSYSEPTWVETVGPSLIYPLINRFLAYYADFSATRRHGRGRSAGAGMSALFGPQTIAALLDTLTILVDLAASTPTFAYDVTTLTLELVSALLLDGDYAMAGAATDADTIPILASALNLFLVTLRHNLYPTNGASVNNTAAFVQRHGEILRPLLMLTRRTFEQSDSHGSVGTGNEDLFRTRVTSRAAALLLLASEMEDSHRALVTSLLGFQL